MSDTMRQANAGKSKVLSSVEHNFGHEKGPMALVIRTIGIARTRVKNGLANLVYGMKRFRWLQEQRAATA